VLAMNVRTPLTTVHVPLQDLPLAVLLDRPLVRTRVEFLFVHSIEVGGRSVFSWMSAAERQWRWIEQQLAASE